MQRKFDRIDFYSIQNEKICDLNLSKFNSVEAKYTTLQRSNLIEFLKEDIYTQHLRFGKKIKEVSELKDKVLIKFDDNTNDLVDFVIAADGIFSNTRSFFEKKKVEPKFKKAIAARVILDSKSERSFCIIYAPRSPIFEKISKKFFSFCLNND